MSVEGSERLKCSNPQCEYLVATNSEKMGSFCCKKCHMHFRGECRKLKHGGLCEKAEAPAELPRAPVVDPKEPLTQGQELPPKKNGKSGKKRNRSEGWEWNEPVAEEPAGIWSGMSQAEQQNMLIRARRRMKKMLPTGHYTRRIRDASPVTDAESSLTSVRKDGNERVAGHRSRSRRSGRSRRSAEHGRAGHGGHTDLRDAEGHIAMPNPVIPVISDGAHGVQRTCPPRPRGSLGASMAASHRDAVSHDEKRCLARRNRTKSSRDRSHPREGGRELVVKKEQIESPRRREDSDREWSRTRHGAASNGLRRLAPGQVFDAFRERSPWSPPLLRRRRARADSDSEYTIDSEESIVTSYTVYKEEAPAPPSTSRACGVEGQPEASSFFFFRICHLGSWRPCGKAAPRCTIRKHLEPVQPRLQPLALAKNVANLAVAEEPFVRLTQAEFLRARVTDAQHRTRNERPVWNRVGAMALTTATTLTLTVHMRRTLRRTNVHQSDERLSQAPGRFNFFHSDCSSSCSARLSLPSARRKIYTIYIYIYLFIYIHIICMLYTCYIYNKI
ncbi:unnamed protein product [Cladocopium goreaui]|uniref:PH domain-containing protein n=1 Tax=Cladocopium goreaui TaxID=2562237 RepID=A0A9P1CRA5_9DINO|nr:unnamed protein product [Cladocopium goreaui]